MCKQKHFQVLIHTKWQPDDDDEEDDDDDDDDDYVWKFIYVLTPWSLTT